MITTTHICVPVKKMIQYLKKGKNLFNVPANEAMAAMIRQQNAGKEYFTGCDNEDEKGMCAGHPDEPTILSKKDL